MRINDCKDQYKEEWQESVIMTREPEEDTKPHPRGPVTPQRHQRARRYCSTVQQAELLLYSLPQLLIAVSSAKTR